MVNYLSVDIFISFNKSVLKAIGQEFFGIFGCLFLVCFVVFFVVGGCLGGFRFCITGCSGFVGWFVFYEGFEKGFFI